AQEGLGLGREWDVLAGDLELTDINADGNLEAILSVSSGWNYQPRGIYALDWNSGRLLWGHRTGPGFYCLELLIRDIDGDSQKEIFSGSHAPGNSGGVPVGGVSDLVTCVFCFNADGELRWLDTIGRYSSRVLIDWLDSTPGKARLVACECGCGEPDRERDSLFIIDANTGEILRRGSTGCLNWDFGVLHSARGKSMVVTAGADETLRILNESLRTVERDRVLGMQEMCLQIGNFVGSEAEETAVLSSVRGLLLYNERLDLLGECKTELLSNPRPFPVRYGNLKRLAFSTVSPRSRLGYDAYALFDFSPKPVLARSVPLYVVLPGALGLLALFGVGMVYARYAQTRDIRTVIRGLTGRAAVIELNRRGDMTKMNAKAREMLKEAEGSHNPSCQEEPRATGDKSRASGTTRQRETHEPLRKALEAAKSLARKPDSTEPTETAVSLGPGRSFRLRIVPVKTGAVVTLEDMTEVEFAERARTLVPATQTLAHRIKNRSFSAAKALEQIEKKAAEDVRTHLASVREDVSRMQSMADAFMRYTRLEAPKPELTDLNGLVCGSVARFAAARPQGVRVDLQLAHDLPLLRLDREQFTSALANLVGNAIAAMGETGVLGITTRCESGDDEGSQVVAIEVRDTGCGIPKQHLARVFEPFFTLRPGGTGLGMAITKRIVEDHHGTISIQSKEGEGTTVTIRLPVEGA
ncbi:MAG: ATP-binding protein, partial [candidate division WOR-3 bacterium]